LKGIAESTYNFKHAEAARLYYTTVYIHTHTQLKLGHARERRCAPNAKKSVTIPGVARGQEYTRSCPPPGSKATPRGEEKCCDGTARKSVQAARRRGRTARKSVQALRVALEQRVVARHEAQQHDGARRGGHHGSQQLARHGSQQLARRWQNSPL